MSSDNTLRFAAVGDLLLTNNPDGSPGRGLEALSEDLRSFFASCDIVFANLECILPGPDIVSTEPRVISTEKQIRSLRDSGINVVTIANNHTYDCFDVGFQRTRNLLSEMEILFFGAGEDLKEAFRPLMIEINGIKTAFIGVVDPSSGQSRFATETSSGPAPMWIDPIVGQIQTLRHEVNHIIVSPHWGEERFRLPSPEQVQHARTLIDAGASMVLGHHPHVMQGMEIYNHCAIAYSLGNFFANEVHFENGDRVTWKRFERTGCILSAKLTSDGIENINQIPVFDDGKRINIETSGWGKQCIHKVNRFLSKGVTPRRYKRESFKVKIINPILSYLRWSKMKRIRPDHFRKAIRLLTANDG